MQEIWIQSLAQEDPLEKEKATHSNIFAWEIPWTEEPGRLRFMGSQQLDTTYRLNHYHQQLILIVNDFLMRPKTFSKPYP